MMSEPESSPDSDAEAIARFRDALEATHTFPCEFMVKVILVHEVSVVEQLIALVRETQQLDFDPAYTTRHTPSGRHISVTLEPPVRSADEVIVLYQLIRTLPGVVMLL